MICQLSKLLFNYNINNWTISDDSNLFSVTLINPLKLKYSENYYQSMFNNNDLIIISDLNINFYKIVDDIKKFVILKSNSIDDHLQLLSELEKIKNKEMRKSLSNDIDKDNYLQYNFIVDDEWIKYNKFIPINVIIYKEKIYPVDSAKLKNIGYGITSFSILIDRTFTNGIYCTGIHPNIGINSNKFCCGSDVYNMEINLDNLLIIRGLLSHINLDKAYNKDIHISKLKPFLIDNN